MGLRRAFKKLWRLFHPQYTAMSQKEIRNMDRAVSESMAKGSFGTRPSAPGPITGDQLWSLDLDTVPPLNNDRLWSMSSHRSGGRLSSVSSITRRRDSGYYAGGGGSGDAFRPPSRRRHSSQYSYFQQQYPYLSGTDHHSGPPYQYDQYDPPYRGNELEEQYQQEHYPSYQHPQSGHYQHSMSSRAHSRQSYVPSDAPY